MLETYVDIKGFTTIDFEKSKVRKTMRTESAEIRKVTRRLLARRAISQPGQFPGKQTGAYQRAVKNKVFRSGFGAVVRADKTAELGADFYPAFLNYGTKNLEARANPFEAAFEIRRHRAESAIMNALQNSIKVR